MEVLHTIGEFRQARGRLTGPLGFVPTMGYLHQGHIELVNRARAENDAVAASIFVNPTQFGPNEDFGAYPRDLDRDLTMLSDAGTTLVFNPTLEEMYPKGYASFIDAGAVAVPMEGAHRLGHFRGVATVVSKLFNIVQPTRAYFGQKDGQQVAVIKRMAADLDMPVEVVVVPTVREADGLAMSSRNVYLSPAERKAAVCVSRGLFAARKLFENGERSAAALKRRIMEEVAAEPLARIEYATLADAQTMAELGDEQATGAVMAALAVRIGKTRLIDNIVLETSPCPDSETHWDDPPLRRGGGRSK